MGMVDKARTEARRVLAALKPAIEAGEPIIGLEPSCLLSMRDEFYGLGLGEDIGRLNKNLYLFEEFLAREAQRGLTLPLKRGASLQSPCPRPLPPKSVRRDEVHAKNPRAGSGASSSN